MHTLTVLALCAQIIGSYVIWPNRWNIPAHLSLGFCVTAYIVPGLLTDVWSFVDDGTNTLYTWINVFGALAMILGLLVGSRLNLFGRLRPKLLALYSSPALQQVARRKTLNIVFFAVLGMIAAYYIMGFVPLFADDPFSAKQFKNEYFEPYYRAAYLFRTSFSLLTTLVPLSLTLWFIERRWWPLLLSCAAVLLLGVSLAREAMAVGVLTFFGFLAARSARGTKWYLLFNAVIYPLGSAGYLLLGLLVGIEALGSIYSFDSIWDIVASGAPDIHDQLNFLDGFRHLNNFTFGRTFVGGLVPGNYMWNPSVWSLTYDDLGADISSMISGGLRFSTALWGYASFSWPGVFFVPFLSGTIKGSFILLLKRLPLNSALWPSALALSLYMIVGKQLFEFYDLSIHTIPAIACILYVCLGTRLVRRKDPVVEQQTAA